MPERGYEVVRLSPTRMLTIDLLHGMGRKPMIHGLIEVDVTLPRRRLREIEARTRERLSFSAFLIHCLATAVTENPHLNAARSGRRLYRFNEVNVGTMVEREQQGEKIVAPLRIDSANKKSVEEIHDEIRRAQAIQIRNVGSVQGWEWVMHIPSPVRRLLWCFIHSRPQMAHRYGLLVSMSAVGMFGEGGGWGIPLTPATVQLTVGGIARRPALESGKVVEHEFLSLTLSFDHEIVDGAPAARFAERLRALVESGHGLPAGDRRPPPRPLGELPRSSPPRTGPTASARQDAARGPGCPGNSCRPSRHASVAAVM
jgi:2-oxoacid dehydrogenases acyltransferase (catalytic domain)